MSAKKNLKNKRMRLQYSMRVDVINKYFELLEEYSKLTIKEIVSDDKEIDRFLDKLDVIWYDMSEEEIAFVEEKCREKNNA
jgi:hypothetical protein